MSGFRYLLTPVLVNIAFSGDDGTIGIGMVVIFIASNITLRIKCCATLERLLLITICFIPTILASQKTIHVKLDAAGNNNGTSWADAFIDLQAGLSAATPFDQIWVAKGVYKPTNTNDRNLSFDLKNRVAVYGGFDGGETELSVI